ncbi:hypothetical protein ACFYU9_34410 [Streptomyces sp. NPDC004327]|uniref:hypothetical protein n=1 Tax=Streptomyces sp. NPDC004327 TaxID=3364699 RepID=UPI0036C8BBBA
MEITGEIAGETVGEGVDEVGPGLGPAITADWPETMAAPVKWAGAGRAPRAGSNCPAPQGGW